MPDFIDDDRTGDGIDRRGFLKCMAWAGTGAYFVLQGGALKSFAMGEIGKRSKQELKGELSSVQITASHIGFNSPGTPDVPGPRHACIEKIRSLEVPPAFLLHTGDLTHLSKAEEFDPLDQSL